MANKNCVMFRLKYPLQIEDLPRRLSNLAERTQSLAVYESNVRFGFAVEANSEERKKIRNIICEVKTNIYQNIDWSIVPYSKDREEKVLQK
jgi:hypothetical protein